MTTELESYAYDAGMLAYTDMLRDRKFQHLGVLPLWTTMVEALEWFLNKNDFSGQEMSAAAEYFHRGWDAAKFERDMKVV